MTPNAFWKSIQGEIDKEEINFRTEDDVQKEINIQEEENKKREKEKKEKLLEFVKTIENKIKIKVLSLEEKQLSIQKDNLIEDMENTMILHSYIIDDIFNLQKGLEEIKVVQNSLLCLLHHSLKHKNKLHIKGNRELETYMASDLYYNEVNMSIKRFSGLIEKSNNYSGLIKQKLGFLREIQKDKTARLYKGE